MAEAGCRSVSHLTRPPADQVEVLTNTLLRVGRFDPAGGDLDRVATAVARRLGDHWLEDTCTFADVTLALHRLTLVVLEADDAAAPRPSRAPRRALAVPAPGDQHSFGSVLVARALRRAGWDVAADVASTPAAIIAEVRRRSPALVAISIGNARVAEGIAALVPAIRAAARGARPLVAVGGPALLDDPSLVDRVGADLWRPDVESLLAAVDEAMPAVA